MRARTLSMVVGIVFVLGLCSEARAEDPPRVSDHIWYLKGTQELVFTTIRGDKATVDWVVTSNGDTAFDPNPAEGRDEDGVNGAQKNKIGATPTPGGGDQVGDIVTFTITVSNDNGNNFDEPATKDVKVVSAGGRGGLIYRDTDPIPTVSEWGLVIMTVLMLTAGTVILGRRRRAAAA